MIIVEQLAFEAEQPTWQDIEVLFSRNPSRRLYALVDGAQDEHLLSRLDKNWPVDKWQSIYFQLPEGNAPEVSPLLVPIEPQENNSASSVFKRLLLPQIIKPESLLFIWSAASLSELAEHLGKYAAIKTFDSKRALLRFHDPNIWPAMLAVQTEAEQGHFFSRIAEVWRPDLDNRWWTYRCESVEKPGAFEPVQWDESRQQRFAALTEPRKILLRLEDEYETQINGSREAWLKKIRDWLAKAAPLGATMPNEHYLYCVTALFAGDGFSEAPEVAEELGAIGKRHADFIKAIQAVSPTTWERLEDARQTT